MGSLKFPKHLRPSLLGWYLSRPVLYLEWWRRLIRDIRGPEPYHREVAQEICRQRATTVDEALKWLGATDPSVMRNEDFDDVVREAAESHPDDSGLMGGGADLRLLHGAVSLLKPARIIETGVALGWSTLCILHALREADDYLFCSVDMPYPRRGTESLVGSVVPESLRRNWILLKLADAEGVPRALKYLGTVDLAHYDSDKTPEGRSRTYNLIWQRLRRGGLLISDDIGDNTAFFEFCQTIEARTLVVRSDEKYVGLAVKSAEGEPDIR